MKCPHCQKAGKKLVVESRPHDGNVYRRRVCGACGKGFVTLEAAPPGLKMPAEVRNSYARRGEPVPTLHARGAIHSAGEHLSKVWR